MNRINKSNLTFGIAFLIVTLKTGILNLAFQVQNLFLSGSRGKKKKFPFLCQRVGSLQVVVILYNLRNVLMFPLRMNEHIKHLISNIFFNFF